MTTKLEALRSRVFEARHMLDQAQQRLEGSRREVAAARAALTVARAELSDLQDASPDRDQKLGEKRPDGA